MIKNYIFDFGNVLAEFYPEKLAAPYVENAEMRQRVCEVVFDRIYWDRLDEGNATDSEVKAGMCSRLSAEEGKLACIVSDNWVKTLSPVKNMQQLVCDIKKSGKKLYLLSNISKGFANSYADVKWIKELLDNFDGVILSGPIGKVKPKRDIFEHLLETFGLKAEECLFIDDSRINIEGAEAVGINGYLFDGDAETLRKHIGI